MINELIRNVKMSFSTSGSAICFDILQHQVSESIICASACKGRTINFFNRLLVRDVVRLCPHVSVPRRKTRRLPRSLSRDSVMSNYLQ